MLIKNPFKMNDWDIKSFVVVVFSIQLAYIGTFAINKLGIGLSFLRQVLGFIYLMFLPGYLLLRILKIHKLSSEESLLYAVGLSLFFDMFVGFLMNMFYPMFGITNRPLSEIPIVATFALTMLLSSILAYLRDREYYIPDFVNLKDILSPQFLFLNLIPFMAIFGTYLVNYYHNNLLLIIMIVVIALVALLMTSTNIIAERLYSYAIWIMAISLILHTTLITNYIQIQDVYGEYHIASRVITKSFWEYTASGTYNSVLSTTILPTVLYHITHVSLTWMYKIIFPFLLSLIPSFFYKIYLRYLPPKASLASAYLLVIIHPYFITIPFLSKQLIAEIFMVLFIHTTITNINPRNILRFIFALAIVFSHYGTAYLILGMLVFMAIYKTLTKSLLESSYNKGQFSDAWDVLFLMIYTVIVIGWYIYVSKATTFNIIVRISYSIIILIRSGLLFNPTSSRGAALLAQKLPLLGIVDKYMYLAISLLMLIGLTAEIISFFTHNKKMLFDDSYLGFSIYWMAILGAAVAIPRFAVMSPYRLYHVSSIVLSPFAIVGTKKLVESIPSRKGSNSYLKTIAIFLVIFLLLNTGVANEILKMPPFYSSSINQKTALKFGTIEDIRMVYGRLITTYDVAGSKWIKTKMDPDKDIYSHSWGYGSSSLHSYGGIPLNKIKTINNNIPFREYIFIMYMLGKFRLWYRLNILGQPVYYNATDLYTSLISNYEVIYTNQYCKVLIS